VDLPAFIKKQCVNIKEDARLSKADFCARITFHAGGYDDAEAYKRLDATLKKFEASKAGTKPGNRLFFLSVPPSVFGVVTQMISEQTRAKQGGYTRLMIEKPFGRDSATFDTLNELTAKHFKETQLFRLDHYLGKEVLLNIPHLRWGNQLFEQSWSNQYIESMQITFKEDLGTGGRGGYFDNIGIIRDIIQNHLLQAFMFLAMEPPKSFSAAEIIKCKCDLLKCIQPITIDDASSVFLGQFGPYGDEKGYLEDDTVPAGSKCATFASLVLKVDNDRWRGVPFLFTAGKGMEERVCEIRIRFKPQPTNSVMSHQEQTNELVMRVQPDEAIYMNIVAKEPGITAEQVAKPVVLDMTYTNQFTTAYLGDAYERMFLNAARGDQALFVSSAELVEAWRIFTPMLHQLDERKPQPVVHPFGSLPKGFTEWAKKSGVAMRPTWHEYLALHPDLEKSMTEVFHELDKDKSGYLDYDEVTALAKRFFDGRQPTKKRIAALLGELDPNQDGKITLEELLGAAQGMQRAFAADLTCATGSKY
jgi:glucose-6-phosphate 1-dehydrogenase